MMFIDSYRETKKKQPNKQKTLFFFSLLDMITLLVCLPCLAIYY